MGSSSIQSVSSRFIYCPNTFFFFFNNSARTATKVQEMIGTVNTSGALSAFEKMEEKGMIYWSSNLNKTYKNLSMRNQQQLVLLFVSKFEVWPVVRITIQSLKVSWEATFFHRCVTFSLLACTTSDLGDGVPWEIGLRFWATWMWN